jgi:hypothetical protein
MAAGAATAQTILVARAVGPNEWRLEGGGPPGALRNIRLLAGQKIILIDQRGTREISGPGELMLLAKPKGPAEPVVSLMFRQMRENGGIRTGGGVRGAGTQPEAGEWETLTARDPAP